MMKTGVNRRRLWRTLLVLATLIFSIELATPARAQEPAPEPAAEGTDWSPPVNLGAYWFPDIAVDSTDTAHIVWANNGDGFDTVMYAARAANGTWSETIDVQAQPQVAGTEATRPSLYFDSNQYLQMTFRDTSIYHSQAPAYDAWNARSWTAPQGIAQGYFSDFVEDVDGVFHVAFTQPVFSENCPICYHLYYTYSEDGGEQWSEPLDISRIPTGAAKPQMLIDRENTIHIVFEAGEGGSYGGLTGLTTVMHVASFDLGRSWTFPVELDPARGEDPNLQARNIAIAEAGNGELIVVWWSFPDDFVNYQRSSDGGRTWTDPQAILGVSGIWSIQQGRLDIYSMATDGSGAVHLVMVGRRSAGQPNAELLHLEWDGISWSRPDPIASYEGDMPEWPRIAIGLGNHLHVVWFVRDEPHIFLSDEGLYRVFYSERLLGIPGTEPVPLAAAVADADQLNGASAETLDEAQLVPTVVPLSAEQREQNTAFLSQQNIRSENDDVLLLLLASLPVLLLIGIILLFVRNQSSSRRL